MLGEIQLQSPNDVNVAEVCSRDTPAVQAFAGTTGASFNVGLKPARMFAGLEGPHLAFECRVVDVRDLDGAVWLASSRL